MYGHNKYLLEFRRSPIRTSQMGLIIRWLLVLFIVFMMGVIIRFVVFLPEDDQTYEDSEFPPLVPRKPSPRFVPMEDYFNRDVEDVTEESAEVDLNLPHGRECYGDAHVDRTTIDLIDDVLTNRDILEKGNNIFFHETTCRSGLIALNVRQACAIESAALTNPDSNIFTVFASPIGFERGKPKSKMFQALDSYENIYLRNVNVTSYAADTPAQDWVHTTDLFDSLYMVSHMSDLLRFLSLYKFGGTHVDLDFIVQKPFSELKPNFGGYENDTIVACGLMHLEKTGPGHEIAEKCVKEFVAKYDGAVWGANGPLLFSRVLYDVCNTKNLTDCTVFNALASHVFYEVGYMQWHWLLTPYHTDDIMKRVSTSVAVHFWNKNSADIRVPVGEGSPYDVLAKKFCPKVYETLAGVEFF